MTSLQPLVVAITGGSGAIFATRLLEVLAGMGQDVDLSISPPGQLVLQQELGLDVRLAEFDIEQLLPRGRVAFDRCPATALPSVSKETFSVPSPAGKLTYHRYDNFMSSLASGSFRTSGMVICPCSGSTLSGIVTGASNNLIQRAAEVHLKERRKLVIVPRETPLSQIALANMCRASELGAVILPAMPGWYHNVRSARDLVDFIVSRILDQFGLENQLMTRWGEVAD